ncbi:MAG: flagellar hook-length control protein FliK [Planctomycetota bacterium]|jgi:flagellar hook-length control protein FliK
MNICPLKNILADNVGTQPDLLKFAANPRPKQNNAITTSNVPPNDTGKTVTTDNSPLIAQNKPNIQPSNNFSHTLGKKIRTKTSPNDKPNQLKDKERSKNAGTRSKMIDPTKSLMIQEILNCSLVQGKAIGTKADNQLQQQIRNQTHNKSVQLLNNSKTLQSPSLVGQAAKSIADKSDQIVSETSGLKNKPIQSTIDQSLVKSEIILPDIPNKSPIGDAKFEKDSDTGEMQKSDKKSAAFTPPSNQQNSKEPISKTLIRENKEDINSEQSAVTNKPLVPENPKTQLSNIQFAALDDQLSNSRQKVLISQANPTQAVEETKPNEADTDHKNRHGKIEISDLSAKNKVQAENLSVKSIAQKMSQPQIQPSALKAEIRSNLLTNQASRPDTAQGEQLLFGNNVQPAVTEQSPASTEFTKIAGNADSGNSVSSQIQESIHSSLQSGNRQVVIRLNPPELGKVAIKFAEQGDDITGLLQVDKPQTRDQLQQALPEIIQNLQDSGIQIKKFEVVLTNQQEQYTPKDQSSSAAQDNWAGQQSSTNPQSHTNNTNYNEWLSNIDNVIEFAEPQAQLAGSSTINMLA